MIIFLDFDGVLHPEFSHESQHFCCLPILQDVVRQLHDCEVVISSTWRFHWSLERLRGNFSPDVAARIVGVTPKYTELNSIPDTLVSYEREAECQAWLRAEGRAHLPWLAIDDRSWLYRPFCRSLFLIDGRSGLTPVLGEKLLSRLLCL
jgi:hypothetical protein